MHQRMQGVGSVAHCGSARSLLLGRGAEHLNQKREVREAAESCPSSQLICSQVPGLRWLESQVQAENRGQGFDGAHPPLFMQVEGWFG